MSWHKMVAGKLRELRFICSFSGESQGMRSFITNNYFKVKESAPEFPFIVRECENALPMVIARYDFGVEKKVCVEGYTEPEVQEAVSDLLAQADGINSHRFISH